MASSSLRLLARNLHDSAALTATSEALPVSNTQRSERPRIWRSLDVTEQVINAELPVGALVDCIALVRHNLGAGGLRRIELLYGEEVVYDSGQIATAIVIPAGIWRAGVDPWGATYNDQLPGNVPITVHWIDRPYLVTGYRITLTGEPPAGYMEIARIIVGEAFRPKTNIGWSPAVEWLESGEHVQTEAGSVRTVGLADLRRRVEIDLDWLNDADRSRLVSLLGKAGLGADLLVALYPESQSTMLELEGTLVCRREASVKTTHSQPGNWQTGLTFIEV